MDEVISLQHDRHLDVMLLCETWHDSNSVCISRLRANGFTVTEQARPRPNDESLTTNHGGVLILSKSNVHHTRLGTDLTPTTLEFVCTRLSSSTSSCVVLTVYRTGPVTSLFFHELSDLLDQLSTYSDPVFLVGDLNNASTLNAVTTLTPSHFSK